MMAASLLILFVLGKIAVLWDHAIAWSSWTIAAYFWQDVAVALLFAVIEYASRRTRHTVRIPAILYSALAVYIAFNIPLGRVLSTPLTWPVLRATSRTLSDSILLYATWANLALLLMIVTAAIVLPRVLSRSHARVRTVFFTAAAIILIIGPAAATRVDTIGLDRNVVLALAASVLPRVDAQAAADEWTAPFDLAQGKPSDDDLSHLRGIAAGYNVVLISLESTAARYLPLYGAVENLTPNLDRLARRGVVFDNAYAVYPESIKGLFSILCSTFPAFDTTPHVYANAPCQSVASTLSQAGYATALFHSGRFAYLGMESIVQQRGYDILQDAGDIGGNHKSSFGVDEPATVRRMLSWIDSVPAGRPFFLTYLPIAGHHPYETPERGPFPTRDEIDRYRNALHYADQSLGALVEGLRTRRLDSRTVWIVIGDHGEAFGQHAGNYGHTFFLYDENVRVPFVIAAPGFGNGKYRRRATVSLIDTAPTILDLLGRPIPASYQGRSTLDSRPRVALFFTDYSLGLVGLRDGRWKFVHELESRRSKLFDMDRDPGETVDLSAEQPRRVAAYEKRLRAWSAAQKSYIYAAP